jgi:hypothetical protein
MLCAEDALASATLGPPFDLDPEVFSAASASTYSAAWDGTNYFVAYTTPADGQLQIRGTRVTPSGTILDPGGIRLDWSAFGASTAGGVGYGAGTFLVTLSLNNGGGNPGGCHAVRVASNGTVLDPTPIVLSQWPCLTSYVTFDGTNFLVAANDSSDFTTSPAPPATVTVSPTGAVGTWQSLDASLPSSSFLPVLGSGFDGAHHVVLYPLPCGPFVNCATDGWPYSSLVVRQVPGGAAGTIATANEGGDVACDGSTGCLVVWLTNTSPPTVQGARIGLDASVRDPAGFTISRSPLPQGANLPPHVRWDGSHYLVVWPSGSSLLGARVTGNALADAADIVVNGTWAPAASPVLSGGASATLIAGESKTSSEAVIVDGALSAQGSPFPFALTGNAEGPAGVASNGSGYLIAWSSGSSAGHGLLVQRLDSNGAPLDAQPIVLSSSIGSGCAVAVASLGSGYLVVWVADSLEGALVPATSAPGMPFKIGSAVTNNCDDVSVAASAAGYLAGWVHSPASYVARVTPEGVVLDPNGILIYSGNTQYVATASDGTDYLAGILGTNDGALHVVPVSSTGVVGATMDAWPDAGTQIVGARPSLVFSGGRYFAAWGMWRNGIGAGTLPPALYASFLTSTGAMMSPNPIVLCSDNACGDVFAVAAQSGFYALWGKEYFPGAEVWGASISTSGDLVPPNGQLLGELTPTLSDGPIVAMSSSSRGIVVYNTLEDVYRMRVRILSFDDAGTPPMDASLEGGADAGAPETGLDATVEDAAVDGNDATVGPLVEAGPEDDGENAVSDAGPKDGGWNAVSDAGPEDDGGDAGVAMTVADAGSADSGGKMSGSGDFPTSGNGCVIGPRGTDRRLPSLFVVVLCGVALRLRRRRTNGVA